MFLVQNNQKNLTVRLVCFIKLKLITVKGNVFLENLDFRGKPGRSSFARFSVELRALEQQIQRISIVSRPEATGCFPESRDTIDFFQESPFVFSPLNICFVSPSPRLERGPSLTVSLPDGRVLTPTERRKF